MKHDLKQDLGNCLQVVKKSTSISINYCPSTPNSSLNWELKHVHHSRTPKRKTKEKEKN